MEYNKTIGDLPQEKCLGTIKNRPISAYVGMGLFGLFFFITEFWYVGILILVMIILSIILTKEFVACKLYKDQIAVFDPKDYNKMALIKYDDILKYETDIKRSSFVVLILKSKTDDPLDVERVGIPTLKASELRRKLLKLIPDQDFANIQAKELEENRLSSKEAKENRKKLREMKKKKVDKE